MTRYIMFFIFLLITITANAQEKKCYVVVENPGSYEQLVVTSITLTMIRQFVDSSVEPSPISGVSNNDCMYRVNVSEQESGIKVFILGNKISDYGSSNLRGEPGLEQGILRAIYKSLAGKSKLSEMCQKYGSSLSEYCANQTANTTQNNQNIQPQQANPNIQQQGGNPPPMGNQIGENRQQEGIPPFFKTYRNPTLGFSLSYPERWQKPSRLKTQSLIFSARGQRELPAVAVFVIKQKPGEKLDDHIGKILKNIWNKITQNRAKVEILESEPFKIGKEGIAAYRSKLKIHTKKRMPIEFVALSTIKNNQIIIAGVWGPDRMPGRLPDDILRTFHFD